VNDELLARFLPRFRAIAKDRLARVRARGDGDALSAIQELHALAGEAAVLGLKHVAELVRAAEARWRKEAWASPEARTEALAVIESAIDEA
jgi:HPt (histidine-containing phosphotransfer) domain-containing protein